MLDEHSLPFLPPSVIRKGITCLELIQVSPLINLTSYDAVTSQRVSVCAYGGKLRGTSLQADVLHDIR
jgi:hypothetical protein